MNQLSEEELASLRFKLKVREQQPPLPDSHTMPDRKYDSHKIDKSTDMLVGDIAHHPVGKRK